MQQINRYVTTAKNSVKKEKLTVIILAAAPGKRMRGRGSKSLLLVDNNTTVLEKQIKTILRMYGDADIIIVTGFQENKVRNSLRWNYQVKFIYNPLYEQKGIVYSLALAMNASVPGNLLIMHGDLVFNAFALSGIMSTPLSKILIDKTVAAKTDESIGAITCDNKVTNLSYGLPDKWGQMVYFFHGDLPKIENFIFDYDNYGQMLLYEIINKGIDKDILFTPFSPSRTKLVEIKDVGDLIKARAI